jgi:hypothetical protein
MATTAIMETKKLKMYMMNPQSATTTTLNSIATLSAAMAEYGQH